METKDPTLYDILRDAQLQLQSLSSAELPPPPPGSEILHIGVQDDDPYYLRTVAQLRAFLLECYLDGRASTGDVEWEPPPRHSAQPYESFWGKFLKLAKPSAKFIHPTRVLGKLDALRNISERSLPEEDIASTDDIWRDERVKEWIASAEPPQIYLHEPPQRSSRLQKFGIELVRHLEEFIPVIHVLGGQRILTKFLQGPVSPASVVEQLVYQAIFHLPSNIPLLVLSAILSLLKKATNEAEWFEVLELICSTLDTPRVAVVIELTDIPLAMTSDVKRWPSEFEKISSNLNAKCGLELQILLLWPRFRLDGPSPETLSGQAVEVRDNVRSRPATSRFPSLVESRAVPLLVSKPPEMDEAPIMSGMDTPSVETLNGAVSPSLTTRASDGVPSTSTESTTGNKILDSPRVADSAGNRQHPPPPGLLHLTPSAPRSTTCERFPKVLDAQQDTVRPPEISISREQIKLAIVCALTLEADAVHALFDEYWEDLEPRDMRSPGDTNAYSFGVFGKFATVLVHMPGMGKTSASIVATNCRNSFPNLKLALVVGICGGVPFCDKGKTEIVLGDVIISEGLVPYDYGRQFPDRFLRKDSASDILGRPPTELRGLLNKLKTRFGRRRLRERTVCHLQVLRTELGSEVDYLGAEQDHLYQGVYMHRHQQPDACTFCSDNAICEVARGSTCEELACDQGKLVARKRLDAILRDGTGLEPVIHFGKIACGDQVMKSGEHRDSIAKEEGVIAFEMEGAGVWDIFPCLVIKAVCDYADSHKHKKWQNYAAGTAASCTKALIQEWYM